MREVKFKFDSYETAESFFFWWNKKIKKKFLTDSKHDDYKYTITDNFFDLEVTINEEVKKNRL